MPFYILCFIITVILIIISGYAFVNEYVIVKYLTIAISMVFLCIGSLNLPLKLDDSEKYAYDYYELLISENKVSSKDDLNEINDINEKIKNGKEAQDNYFLKNYNYNHEWAKLDELDIDKAYKSYIEYMEKNND